MNSSGQALWTKVDRYFGDLLVPSDPSLEEAIEANRQGGLPPIDVTPLQGKFLEFLARVSGARRILEIGTLGGYSTIWHARALPEGGRVVTLEIDPAHAEVARANIEIAGVADRVDVEVGPALATLPTLESRMGPFGLIFIDADKAGYPEYLRWALKLSRPGTVIVADNVVREGKVVDPESGDADVDGVRRFMEMLAAEPRLSSTALQTVGVKGYDGFALGVVLR